MKIRTIKSLGANRTCGDGAGEVGETGVMSLYRATPEDFAGDYQVNLSYRAFSNETGWVCDYDAENDIAVTYYLGE